MTYSCADGYYDPSDIGTFTVECEAGKIPAVGDMLLCSVSCGVHPEAINGEVALVSSAMVFYNCLDGYKIRSGGSVKCRENGTWSDTVGIECSLPCSEHEIVVGNNTRTPIVSNSTNGSLVVTYHCLDGYHPDIMFQEPHVITCVNGHFQSSESALNCVEDCPELTLPLGVIVSNSSHYEVTYTCLDGYEHAAGNLTVECADGSWQGMLPACYRLCSSSIPQGELSTYTVYGSSYSAMVSYKCIPGSHPSHNFSELYNISCINGTFTNTDGLRCEYDCPQLMANASIAWEISPYSANATCFPGWTLVGSPVTMCDNGTWESQLPVCKRNCQQSTIANVSNSVFVTSGDPHNLSVTYSCMNG